MFLFINTTTRHQLFSSISEVIQRLKAVGKPNTKYTFTILEPGESGEHDLVLILMSEPISGGTYIHGYIQQNQTNIPHNDIISMFAGYPIGIKKQVPLHSLYPSEFVKGGKYIAECDVSHGDFTEANLKSLIEPSVPTTTANETPKEEDETETDEHVIRRMQEDFVKAHHAAFC